MPKTQAKPGDWVPIAAGAIDARDKLRRCHKIVTDMLISEPTVGATFTWVNMRELKEVHALLGQAGTDLTLGLKGNRSKSAKR
jgi:hypothetical protein